MALTQLFVSERRSLQNLIVKGDIIVNKKNKDGKKNRSSCRLFSPVLTAFVSDHDTVADEDQYAARFLASFLSLWKGLTNGLCSTARVYLDTLSRESSQDPPS